MADAVPSLGLLGFESSGGNAAESQTSWGVKPQATSIVTYFMAGYA